MPSHLRKMTGDLRITNQMRIYELRIGNAVRNSRKFEIRKLFIFLFCFCCASFSTKEHKKDSGIFLIVLGTAQDGGYPQAGCLKNCCKHFYDGQEKKHAVSCLAIVDKANHKCWLLDATPDFREQWHEMQMVPGFAGHLYPDGIFLTHAHIGHYTGLMDLGREVMGAQQVPVYAMPRMAAYLTNNGPWGQLVSLKNIEINPLHADSSILISNSIKVTPFLVPHRDEYSETVGYKIESANKKILFIPDIDKWEKWGRNIIDEVKNVDAAFVDGTFYKDGELSGRTMKEVPHPFIEETMKLFSTAPEAEKKKIFFIHFNHTNPVIWDKATQKELRARGFNYVTEGMSLEL